MRKYIRQDDLASTLRQIVSVQDPEMMKVYREVILYRASKDAVQYAQAANMLLIPQRLLLSCLNIALTPAVLLIFAITVGNELDLTQNLLVLSVAILFALGQARLIWRLKAAYQQALPYLLVDELLARKILVMTRRKSSIAGHAK